MSGLRVGLHIKRKWYILEPCSYTAMRRGLRRHRTLSLILPLEGMFHYEQAEAAVKERRGRRTLYRLHMPPLRWGNDLRHDANEADRWG